MFDEESEPAPERPTDPAQRAREKSDEFRMHAELCAVFEGCAKFDAQLRPGLDAGAVRDLQRAIGRLEKARSPEAPLIPEPSAGDAAGALTACDALGLATNDYHVHRRPGEVMVVRWLGGAQVESFYDRLQAHFDAALSQHREDERQAHGWKQDPGTLAYLEALDTVEVRMADRYLRGVIREHGLFVLSTQAADEIDILYLCETIMRVPAADLVGRASAPPDDDPTEQDRAWFFKLFSLRGRVNGSERMLFFAYLQKTEEGF